MVTKPKKSPKKGTKSVEKISEEIEETVSECEEYKEFLKFFNIEIKTEKEVQSMAPKKKRQYASRVKSWESLVETETLYQCWRALNQFQAIDRMIAGTRRAIAETRADPHLDPKKEKQLKKVEIETEEVAKQLISDRQHFDDIYGSITFKKFKTEEEFDEKKLNDEIEVEEEDEEDDGSDVEFVDSDDEDIKKGVKREKCDETDVKPEFKPNVKQEIKLELKSEIKSEFDVKPVIKSEFKTEIKSEIKSEVKSEIKSEVKDEEVADDYDPNRVKDELIVSDVDFEEY